MDFLNQFQNKYLSNRFKTFSIIMFILSISGTSHAQFFNRSISGDSAISASVFGSPLVIRTSTQFAGAISSVTWRGKEFINTEDHGRELQSAVSFDNFGECYNPTEAGGSFDGRSSTSQLLNLKNSGSIVETTSQMAFWLRPGTNYPQGCAGRPNITQAQNQTELSDYKLSKRVAIGFRNIENVIEYTMTFHVPKSHTTAVFEALTGYMPDDFSAFWTYEPRKRILEVLSDGPGEQSLPVILSTSDKKYAMGIYSHELPQISPASGYGRFSFPVQRTMKWNAVYRSASTPAGDYTFRLYVIVGTLEQVEKSMTQLDGLWL